MTKVPYSNREVVGMLPNPPFDQKLSSARVWSGIWSITKYVLLFCLGMVVGALFLSGNDVQKQCLESMVAIGFNSHRAREICYKNSITTHNGVLTRFDCMPRNANAQDCRRRGCIWDESVQNVPYCFYPDNYGSYANENVTNVNGKMTASMRRKLKSPYPEDVDLLQFEACAETESRLHIKVPFFIYKILIMFHHVKCSVSYLYHHLLQITDAKKDRFEPFYPVVPQVDCKTFKNSQFQVKMSEGKMGFKVLRSSTNKVM